MVFLPELDRQEFIIERFIQNWICKTLKNSVKIPYKPQLSPSFVFITHRKNTQNFSVYSLMYWPGRNKSTVNLFLSFLPFFFFFLAVGGEGFLCFLIFGWLVGFLLGFFFVCLFCILGVFCDWLVGWVCLFCREFLQLVGVFCLVWIFLFRFP